MTELLNTAAMGDLARISRAKVYETFDTPECAAFLPDKAPIGESRQFNFQRALLFMIHCDLHRSWLSIPAAGRVTCRIGEALFQHPGADRVAISFHENGASLFVADNGDADLPSDDMGAGRLRFRVTFDLSAYRDAISAALESQRHAA